MGDTLTKVYRVVIKRQQKAAPLGSFAEFLPVWTSSSWQDIFMVLNRLTWTVLANASDKICVLIYFSGHKI